MNFYFAPLEGLTGHVYRTAHHTYYPEHIDKYFAPFILANQSESFKTKELNDLIPENNQGFLLIPQILTNNAKDFIVTANKISQFGYDEINLNLGCPSGTVVSKNRGSGFLAMPDELDAFLDEIFSKTIGKISIKTRIGKEQPEEFYELLNIFNKYPIKELTIHPRTQKDFYKNEPNLAIFKEAVRFSKNPLCYNGDIVTEEDYKKFTSEFPMVESIMIGRGLLGNPGFVQEITDHTQSDKKRLKDFHDSIYKGYQNILFGDKNVLFKMKELWFYMILQFPDGAKDAKKIKKAERLADYEIAVNNLFQGR